MRRLAGYLKAYRKQLIFGPLCKLSEAVFELITPLVMTAIIDTGIGNRDTAYVWQMGLVMVGLGAAGLCLALICQYSAAKTSQGFGTSLRNDLFRHIQSLSYAEYDRISADSLVTRMTNDINQLQVAVAMLIRLVIRAPFLVIGATVMAMTIDLKLSVIFLITAPVVAGILYIIMKLSVPYFRMRQRTLDQVSEIAGESMTGSRVIRAFSMQSHESKRFAEKNHEVTDLSVRVGKLSALLNPAMFLVMNLAIVCILWFGGYRVQDGGMTQGEMVAFVNYMTQISLALVVVANLVVIFSKAHASANRINEVFNISCSMKEPETPVYTTRRPLPGQSEDTPLLVFDHVSFAYDTTEECALEEISFSVRRGETVGIIGGTGSGKSTLVQLIGRLYDCTKGEIRLDGVCIKDMSYAQIREYVGLVAQKTTLFAGSIRDNLQLAGNISEEAMYKAIRVAQADEFIMRKPDQLDALLTQNAKNLSGGQRQRLSIARCLAAEPQLLILDDSSSALDYATDSKLRAGLASEYPQMSILTVSQRVNTIEHADCILVLEDGRLAGQGTHRELFHRCELYREICTSQGILEVDA